MRKVYAYFSLILHLYKDSSQVCFSFLFFPNDQLPMRLRFFFEFV